MFINESFLSFIWQFQYYSKKELTDLTGNEVSVIYPGNRNHDEGPDFSNSIIRIGEVTWHGNVEIHIKASHWNDHEHEKNPKYDNVILHVVWENDTVILRSDGTSIPTLDLRNRIDNALLYKFHNLVDSPNPIPCAADIAKVNPIHRDSMIDNMLVERIKEKAEFVLGVLKICGNDWEEVTYRMFLRNFGFKINQHPMMAVATYLPFKLIQKHSDDLFRIEALLFGTAGFLKGKCVDEYHQKLKEEYGYLRKKYEITHGFLSRNQWKFMRTHPSNFPTVRIAQLASFLYKRDTLFGLIREVKGIYEIAKFFNNSTGDYWITHYDFGKTWTRKNRLGKNSIHGLIINIFLPVLGAYSIYIDDTKYIENAIDLLGMIPAEENRITRIWEGLGLKNRNAAESQAVIHLYNNYCIKKKCLNCKIGMKLLQANDLVLDS